MRDRDEGRGASPDEITCLKRDYPFAGARRAEGFSTHMSHSDCARESNTRQCLLHILQPRVDFALGYGSEMAFSVRELKVPRRRLLEKKVERCRK